MVLPLKEADMAERYAQAICTKRDIENVFSVRRNRTMLFILEMGDIPVIGALEKYGYKKEKGS